LNQEQSRKNSAKEIRGISTITQVSSARDEKGKTELFLSALKNCKKTIKQAEALLRELTHSQKGGEKYAETRKPEH
jgi:hypothetical protein